jgi:hypothetical protein
MVTEKSIATAKEILAVSVQEKSYWRCAKKYRRMGNVVYSFQ